MFSPPTDFLVPERARDRHSDGVQRTLSPIVTGTSVLGLKYKDGVMMASDTLASYGSLARYCDIQRLEPVGNHTVIGAGGDMSDFQYMKTLMEALVIEEFTAQDGHTLGPAEIHEYLARELYHRRSEMNPLWNSLVVGGIKDGKRFLGYVDLLGTTYTSSTVATGYGSYIAQPLLRKDVEGKENDLTEEEASQILEKCMRVLFYRDCRTLNKYQMARITADGPSISEPRYLSTQWGFGESLSRY